MAIGPRHTRADELSDLRANNQLLQQRLDQLAAAAGAAPVAPGTPSLAGSFPRSFLILRCGRAADFPASPSSTAIGGNAIKAVVRSAKVGSEETVSHADN